MLITATSTLNLALPMSVEAETQWPDLAFLIREAANQQKGLHVILSYNYECMY